MFIHFLACIYTQTAHTVVSQVSTQGRLNITPDFGPHRHLSRIAYNYYVHKFCMEAETWCMGALTLE